MLYGTHAVGDDKMASKGAGENRLKSYKTKGLDVEEVRRRREEEGIQLRRSRRDELVSLTGNTCKQSHVHHIKYIVRTLSSHVYYVPPSLLCV